MPRLLLGYYHTVRLRGAELSYRTLTCHLVLLPTFLEGTGVLCWVGMQVKMCPVL